MDKFDEDINYWPQYVTVHAVSVDPCDEKLFTQIKAILYYLKIILPRKTDIMTLFKFNLYDENFSAKK